MSNTSYCNLLIFLENIDSKRLQSFCVVWPKSTHIYEATKYFALNFIIQAVKLIAIILVWI